MINFVIVRISHDQLNVCSSRFKLTDPDKQLSRMPQVGWGQHCQAEAGARCYSLACDSPEICNG